MELPDVQVSDTTKDDSSNTVQGQKNHSSNFTHQLRFDYSIHEKS
jgi:hypothetical protein